MCVANQPETVRQLLEAGAGTSAADTKGRTPLMYCVAKVGLDEVAQDLVNAGADTEATDNEESTARILAAMRGRLEIVRILLKAGANTMSTNARARH